jgi:hypothetical protein
VINGGGYTSQVVTETYFGVCPPATFPVWNKLYWDSVINCSPGACAGTNESSITFAVQTGNYVDGGTTTYEPSTPVTVATIKAANPAICTPATTPSASCPVFLNGGAIVPGDMLKLTITLLPSPDALAAPTLNMWQIDYSCLPSE